MGAMNSAQGSASSPFQKEQETLAKYTVEGLGIFLLPEGFIMDSGEITGLPGSSDETQTTQKPI